LSKQDCDGICQLAAAVLHVTNIRFEDTHVVSSGDGDNDGDASAPPAAAMDAAALATLPTAVTKDSVGGVGLAATLLEVAASTLQWKVCLAVT
jgi:hypothetical protein